MESGCELPPAEPQQVVELVTARPGCLQQVRVHETLKENRCMWFGLVKQRGCGLGADVRPVRKAQQAERSGSGTVSRVGALLQGEQGEIEAPAHCHVTRRD